MAAIQMFLGQETSKQFLFPLPFQLESDPKMGG